MSLQKCDAVCGSSGPDFEFAVPLEKRDYGPLQEEKSRDHCAAEWVDGRSELGAAARNPLKSLGFQRIFCSFGSGKFRQIGERPEDYFPLFSHDIMIK